MKKQSTPEKNTIKNEINEKSAITTKAKSRTEKISNVVSQRGPIQSITYANETLDKFTSNLKNDIINRLPDQFARGALGTYHGVLFVFVTTDTSGDYYKECFYVVEPNMELDISDANLFRPVTEMILSDYSQNYVRTAQLGDGIEHIINIYLFEEIDDDDDEVDDEDEYEDQ